MARRGKSFFIRSSGPNDKALEAGLQWLAAAAATRGGTGLVAVSMKGILENLSWSKFAPIFAALHKNGECRASDVALRLFTGRKPSVNTWDGPILAIHGSQQLLDTIDGLHGEADVLYIPWIEGEYENWAATWNATAIGDGASTSPAAEPTSGVVLIALQQLTAQVNVSTGIVHPSDRQAAIRTLETLHHKQSKATPEQIRRQLIRLEWDPKDAQTVMELAEFIASGRRPKGSLGRADEDLWSYWESKVE